MTSPKMEPMGFEEGFANTYISDPFQACQKRKTIDLVG
jgi:hypothetical protein